MHLTKPLSRFFRPAPPPPPSPETQIAALDSAPAELIVATALGTDEALRTAAVRKLPDGAVLRNLAGLDGGASHPSPALERIAQERMAQLIDAGAVDLAGLYAAGNTSAVLCVAGLCSDPACLPQALASIDDPKRIAKLVIEGASSRLRQLAAQSIEDPTELREILRQVRGKDKSVYKIIKQKCDVLHAEEQRIAQIESDINALCASLERHSRRVYDPLYAASLRQFDAQWKTLETQAAAEIRERVHQAIDRCREVIDAHERKLAEQAADASRQAARRAAREEAGALAAEEAQRRNEAAALAAAESAKLREAEEKARAEKLAAEELSLRQVGGLIGKANGALRDGNTGRAAGLRRAIEEKLPLPAMPAYLASQVQKLDAKLSELKEWKDYAVAPKRAELIEEMEALIGASEEPKVLADKIQQLRDQWKTISKGIVIESETDWQRFNQAAHTAYQPCRDYFEAQAKLRQENEDKRRSLLERFRAFETAQSGEHPDWRAVVAVLREARQEWRQHFPVDRVAGRASQEEFDASIDRLQSRLDAWHAQNIADKKALIQRAEQLRTKEDNREAVDAVKRLQLQWKETGTVPRDQEQPLWEKFREQCDAVFQKRQQAYTDYTAGLEAAKTRAVALCEEVEHTAALSGTALREGAAKIVEWRAAFEALGEMPRADERKLHERFERALALCHTQISREQAHDKERSFTNLLEAARRIQAYGWAVAQGAASADREAQQQSAEIYIAGVEKWPKGGAEALKGAWTKAHAAVDHEAAAHENVLRMLCIRGEILTDTPTPPEDHALRRDYQVQRLVQRMEQRNEASPDALDALALEWIRVGPVSATTYEPLLARFARCRKP